MKNFQIKYTILVSFIALIIVIFDQITKYWALYNLDESYSITFFLSLTLSFNKGISFGMFNEPGTSQIILVLIASAMVIALFTGTNSRNIIPSGLVIGGAIGNLIDRLRVGAVVDFIHLHYSHYHFPIFNVADISICCGCLIFVMLEIKLFKNQPKAESTQ
jgi:signal peptidase II